MSNIYDPLIEEQGTLFLTVFPRGESTPVATGVSTDFDPVRGEYRWTVAGQNGWFDCIVKDADSNKVAAGVVYLEDDDAWYRIDILDTYLEDKLDSLCEGTGIRKFQIIVTDDQDPAAPLDDVKVTMVKTGLDILSQYTNESGVCEFSLSDGLWEIRAYKTGYQHVPETVNVTADDSKQVVMDMTGVPPVPPTNNKVRGICYVYDENSEVQAGVDVSIRMVQPATETGDVFSKKIVTVQSDADGLVEFPALFVGGTYEYWRGDASQVGIVQLETYQIPEDALDPHELPSIVGMIY